MFYLDLFRKLQEEGVRYLVAGGVALNLHGVPRMTADVDLIVDLEGDNPLRFLKVMNGLAFSPAVPVRPDAFADPAERDRWRREKNMMVLTFVSPLRPAISIDVFVSEPLPFGPAFERRKRVYAERGAVEVPVVSGRDLLDMKERSGREQDRSDAEALRKALETKA